MKFADLIQKREFSKTILLPNLYAKGFKKLAYAISQCADFLDYALCMDCRTLHFNGFSSCKQRLCPVCSKKRSLLLFKRFVPVLKDLLNEGYYINGLNFTIVDSNNLDKSLNTLNKAFRILSHDDKTFAKEFKKRFVGGVRATEVKIGSNSGLWHPHLHCLVVKDKFEKDYTWLSEAWNKAVMLAGGVESKTTPGLYGMVSIFSLKDKHDLNSDKEKSVEIGVVETFKYITKFDFDVDIDYLPELIKSVKGVRMINTWGILRKINLDIENEMNKPYREVFQSCCTMCGGTDFFEFTTRHIFHDVHDFDLEYSISRLEPVHKPGLAMIWPDACFKVGEVYNGIMWTDSHERLRGQSFNVIYENGYYVYNQPVNATKTYTSTVFVKGIGNVEDGCKETVPSFHSIRFTPEMLTFYAKDIKTKQKSTNNC